MLTRNVKIMLALLAIALLYTFVLGCDDTSISIEGDVEDWYVEGLDDAIEDATAPVLNFGDAVVDLARDTEEAAIEWGFDTTGGQ